MTDRREVEERLRDALRARAREFTISPDAWEKTRARRGDAMTRLRSHRGGRLRWIAPLAAAAAVVAIAAGLLAERGQPGPSPAGGQTPAASSSSPAPSPSGVLPSLSPTHTRPPKGLRVPAACVQTNPAPPVYTVAGVSLASMPAVASTWFQQEPPATGIVRVDMSYRGDQATTYLWFTHPKGRPEALVERTHHLLSTSAVPDQVQWHGNAPAFLTSIPRGQAGLIVRAEGDRAVTYDFGLATQRAASATVTVGSPAGSLTGLEGPSGPVPAQVISGHGFPYPVWVAAFPATPLYGTVVFRDAAGASIGTGAAYSFPLGTMCVPLAYLNYQPPRGGHAYITGGSLPQVASVTAVLPGGSQVRGEFSAGGGVKTTGYMWFWTVTLPRKDANVTVTVLFKDAAGHVLGHFTTVPGKNPYPPIRR